ncbi:16S rRNA (guanine527-N7)-methyltransferase [Devosia enhydra]|uniref:Ribosomal RNA small subunit methyltransferase G n=1 Tax=Devosia enhydra TaxID=665118 RepID=A0A1K2I0B6_9HYPH|nr:16S rRNA (guanine(527)-N(7))-methyltransferase RsmG [Devosia enhydra]SFZ85077.1 16S rRNA (guanine527-N7)-methyltransferase [Devosia enhydra]
MRGDLSRYSGFLTRSVGEVTRDLESYASLIRKWNAAQNLVSRETTDLWDRHLIDGVQLVRYIQTHERILCDIGSGGGIPAIPLATALKGSNRRHYLVEPIAKKAAFLRQVRRELGLDGVEVLTSRIEDTLLQADLVTARAVTALTPLLGLVAQVMAPTGRALLHKGREHVDEIAAARAKWAFDVIVHPSDIDGDGVILEVSSIRPL